jgi:hypothetical protein
MILKVTLHKSDFFYWPGCGAVLSEAEGASPVAACPPRGIVLFGILFVAQQVGKIETLKDRQVSANAYRSLHKKGIDANEMVSNPRASPGPKKPTHKIHPRGKPRGIPLIKN